MEEVKKQALFILDKYQLVKKGLDKLLNLACSLDVDADMTSGETIVLEDEEEETDVEPEDTEEEIFLEEVEIFEAENDEDFITEESEEEDEEEDEEYSTDESEVEEIIG